MPSLRFAACAFAGLTAAAASTLIAWSAAGAPPSMVRPGEPLALQPAAGCDLELQGKALGSFTLISAAPVATLASGQSTGRRAHAPLVLEHAVDSSSPKLMQMRDGANIPTATLTCRKAGGKPLTYVLRNAMISQVSTVPGPGDRPRERVTLVYESIEVR